MAVGEVMHGLPHGPAAFAIGCVELRIAQPAHRRPQLPREEAQSLDVCGASGGRAAGLSAEAADWIAQVVQFCHGENITTPTVPASHWGVLKQVWIGSEVSENSSRCGVL